MFSAFVANHHLFLDKIQKSWFSLGYRIFPLSCFFQIKRSKGPIKTLCEDNFSNITALSDPSPDSLDNENQARDVCAFFLYLAGEIFFRQHSQIKWLEAGDLNTRFSLYYLCQKHFKCFSLPYSGWWFTDLDFGWSSSSRNWLFLRHSMYCEGKLLQPFDWFS